MENKRNHQWETPLFSVSLFHKRRLTAGVIFAVLSAVFCLLSGAVWWTALLFLALFLLGSLPEIRFRNEVFGAVVCIAWGAIAAFAVFLLIQMMLVESSPFSMTWEGYPLKMATSEMLNNEWLYIAVFLFVFVILCDFNLSMAIGSMLMLCFCTVEFYVYKFRGGEITPSDFFAIKTALNVAGRYRFWLDPWVVCAWCGVVFLLFLTYAGKLKPRPIRGRIWKRAAALICCAGCLFMFVRGIRWIQGTHWKNEGTYRHGYLVNFAIGLRQSFVDKPDNYSFDAISELEKEYIPPEAPAGLSTDYPDVIVVMNESFTDFSVYGDNFHTNEEVTPFYNGLKENTIKGYVLASGYGGGTANSEYEFLTGNTMAFLPSLSTPYQQYIHGETYSLVKLFHSLGYYCLATHPYLESGWSRPTVYRAFGFDEMTFEQDYPNKDLQRGLISDNELTDYIIQRYEQLSQDGNVFMHCVSMQNHGGYTYFADHGQDTEIKLVGYEQSYPMAEEYLTMLQLSDAATEKLVR